MENTETSKPDLEGIAKRMKYLLGLHQLSSKQLADILDISPPTVSNIINAKNLISTDILIKVGNFFQVSTDYILTGKSEFADDVLYRHQIIAQEIQNKIKDIESNYQKSDTSRLLAIVPDKNKTSFFDLIEIIAKLYIGGSKHTISSLFEKLDKDTLNILMQINKEFIDLFIKRQRTEESK